MLDSDDCDVLAAKPNPDERGCLYEIYRAEWPGGFPTVQWNACISKAGVVRGVCAKAKHCSEADFGASPRASRIVVILVQTLVQERTAIFRFGGIHRRNGAAPRQDVRYGDRHAMTPCRCANISQMGLLCMSARLSVVRQQERCAGYRAARSQISRLGNAAITHAAEASPVHESSLVSGGVCGLFIPDERASRVPTRLRTIRRVRCGPYAACNLSASQAIASTPSFGRMMRNVVPTPGSLSISIWPC